MHVELYKVFVFWKMRYLSVSIRSMHVELYKFLCFGRYVVCLRVLDQCMLNFTRRLVCLFLHVELYKVFGCDVFL